MPISNEYLEYLKASKRRNYASFFEGPDKGIKEKFIVETLFETLGNTINYPIESICSSEKDPPDVTIKLCNQQTIGAEVTELVSEEAVRRNSQGAQVYKSWEPNEVIKKIQEILLKKDRKKFHGGPYERLFLVIHTDELLITPDNYSSLLKGHQFSALKQITEVFFMFSYHGGAEDYPVIQLSIGQIANPSLNPTR